MMRIPIAVALTLVGFIGNSLLMGLDASLAQLHLILWELGNNFLLITIPLFIWMGHLAHASNMGADLYKGLNIWLGRLPGGLAIASITSSASFGSVTGSSIATVSTIGKILLPEIQKHNHNLKLATGSIASAGVLAILIPPSIPLVFYATWTETSIADLFLAGIVPGLALTLMFSIYALIYSLFNPDLQRMPASSFKDKLYALAYLLPAISIISLILLSIFFGIATPSEAAAIGVAGIFIFGLAKKRLTRKNTLKSINQSATLSSNIFLLLVGGLFFSRFIAQTGIIEQAVNAIILIELPSFIIFLGIILLYLILGAVLDTFGMIVLTLPLVYPLVISLGFDPIWFGIFLVLMIEVSLITPPIGLNVFVLQRLANNISLASIFYGCLPFVIITLLLAILIIKYPMIVMWLPEQVSR
jgi:tripartite ATP-independent transporter DctM subunit